MLTATQLEVLFTAHLRITDGRDCAASAFSIIGTSSAPEGERTIAADALCSVLKRIKVQQDRGAATISAAEAAKNASRGIVPQCIVRLCEELRRSHKTPQEANGFLAEFLPSVCMAPDLERFLRAELRIRDATELTGEILRMVGSKGENAAVYREALEQGVVAAWRRAGHAAVGSKGGAVQSPKSHRVQAM
jgi:hypothetical protein